MQHQAPPQGNRTLCELQCRLVTAPAGSRSALPGPACPDADLAAAAAAQPSSYAPVVKCPSGQWPPSYSAEDGAWDSKAGSSRRSAGGAGLRPLLAQLVGAAPGSAAACLERLLGLQQAAPPGAPLAWHPRAPLLAAVDADDCCVQLFDYTGVLPLLGQGGTGGPPPPPLHPSLVLRHELQQQASALAWRPHGGKCLAVGVAHGACLWHIGRPPAGSGSRSDSGAWMTWLGSPAAGPVTTLAWHPQGHLLAAACPQSAGFHVWDVATGTATPISAGPEPVALLRWSPCGTFLLAGHPSGAFRIWQTQTWWSQSWSAADSGAGGAPAGRLLEACWGPDSRTLLLAYDSSPQLVSLHFTGEPPSLQAQLLPLPLPELGAKGAGTGTVEAVAWDARAARLALAVGGAHPAAGTVALYDTRCDPIVSARFIGFMRLGPLAEGGSGAGAGVAAAGGSWAAAAAAEADWEEIQPEEVAEAAGAVGGAAPTSVATTAAAGQRSGATAAVGQRPQLAFLPGFSQGAVLAARQGAVVATVPMYFAA